MSQTVLHPKHTALIVVDVQKAFDEMAATSARNNPQAEVQIAKLMAIFRGIQAPIFHFRHRNDAPQSRFNPANSGFAVQDGAREQDNEPVIVKTVNSCFIGTDLEARLRGLAINTLVIVGATTNHCVETTTRMAGNLGFDTYLVSDACWTFERTGPDGRTFAADDIHAMSLSNLHGEFCTVIDTAKVQALFDCPSDSEKHA